MDYPPPNIISAAATLILLAIFVAARPRAFIQSPIEPTWQCVLVGFPLGNFVVPAIYTFILLNRLGPPIQDRLYPGVNEQTVGFWLVGTAIVLATQGLASFLRLIMR